VERSLSGGVYAAENSGARTDARNAVLRDRKDILGVPERDYRILFLGCFGKVRSLPYCLNLASEEQ
jgi:hypothetical protein